MVTLWEKNFKYMDENLRNISTWNFSWNSKQKGKMKLNWFCSEWIVEVIVSKEELNEDGHFKSIEHVKSIHDRNVPDSTGVLKFLIQCNRMLKTDDDGDDDDDDDDYDDETKWLCCERVLETLERCFNFITFPSFPELVLCRNLIIAENNLTTTSKCCHLS